MSYSLTSFTGVCIGDYIIETIIWVNKGDTRSLDYGSYRVLLDRIVLLRFLESVHQVPQEY